MLLKDIISTIVSILIGLSIIAGGLAYIIRWANKVSLKISKIEDKIERLPTEIENKIINVFLPYASTVINTINNPLPPEKIELMRRLMIKLQNRTISVQESIELKQLLEIEKEEAEQKNKSDILLAIAIALAAIAIIITVSDSK